LSLCSEFRVAFQHGTQNINIHNRTTTKKEKEISNTEFITYRYITGQHEKKKKIKQHGIQNIKTNKRTTHKNKRKKQNGTQNIKIHNKTTQQKQKK
jgi:hypothetical protein